jgi:transposase
LREWSNERENHQALFIGDSEASGSNAARASRRIEYPSEWAAIQSIPAKFSCTAETLRRWLRQTQTASVKPKEPPSNESECIKALERENRELLQANEILRKASAYFAQTEFDYPQGTSTRPNDESVHRRSSRRLWSRADRSARCCRFPRRRITCTRHAPPILIPINPRQAGRSVKPTDSPTPNGKSTRSSGAF